MRHYSIVTHHNGLDIAVVGPETYETFAPESMRMLKEMGLTNMLDEAYEAGIRNGFRFHMGQKVKWSGMPNETFTIIGIKKLEVMIEGDFSGIGIFQADWANINEVTPA